VSCPWPPAVGDGKLCGGAGDVGTRRGRAHAKQLPISLFPWNDN
jgi:hypothetical protein